MKSAAANSIRGRHGNLYQKLRALNTAVDEHFSNIKVRVDYGELTRPTSSVYRTPKYVTMLCKNLETEIVSLRADLCGLRENGQCVRKDWHQLDSLVTDLENQFWQIDKKMSTRRVHLSDLKNDEDKTDTDVEKPVREKSAVSRATSVYINRPLSREGKLGVSSEADLTTEGETVTLKTDTDTDSCSTITLPKLDTISHTSTTSHPQPSTTAFTLIPINPAHQQGDNKRGILKRQPAEAKGGAKRVVCERSAGTTAEQPKKVTFSHVSRMHMARERTLVRQASNVGYPYGSSFPALPPVPSRRRYITHSSNMTKTLQSPLKTNIYRRREKSWLY